MELIALERSETDISMLFIYFFSFTVFKMSVSRYFLDFLFFVLSFFLSSAHMPVLALCPDVTVDGGARPLSRESSCLP